MSFLEVKGSLAKLLATENLHVQHDGVAQTASFNTATRVLTLPILKTEESHVYDMFVGHEVGHALWTPVDWRDHVDENTPFDFVNVIEDVRIEKAIQSKFPGLRVDFARGYDSLHDQDFFDIADKNLSELNFIDRINLHFKLGSRALIPFSDEEMTYVRAIEDADTFDKVCLLAKMVAEYVKAKREEEQQKVQTEMAAGQSDDEDDDKQEGDSDDTKPEESKSEDAPPVDTKEAGDDLVSETQRAMDEALKNLADVDEKHPQYLTAPKEALSPFPIEFLREDFVTMFDSCGHGSIIVKDHFKKFMSSIKRDVNFMVQQFEMKKSADAYARQQIHKTGVLNTELLHNYKLTDDLFLRQTVTPDGKNHGLYLLVDWSGSMSDHILETVKQILVLVQFCRKVNIPFEVVTFTCQGYGGSIDPYSTDGQLASAETLTTVLSSREKRRDIDQDMLNFYSQARKLTYSFSAVPYSNQLSMGGTPLNNVLLKMPLTLEKFKRDNNIQKLSFVCLTDGESSPIHFLRDSNYGPRVVMTSPYTPTLLRDGHKVYQIDSMNETPSIVNYIEKRVQGVSITNIFLSGPKGALRYYNDHTKQHVSDLPEYKKHGSYSFTTKNGWPLISVVNPRCFTDSADELEVEQGAGKAKVKSALKKFLKNKTTSKVLLSTLVTQFS